MMRSLKEVLKEHPFLLATCLVSFGARYNPYFFQLLFESQSFDLVTELFKEEISEPWISNPLECFVTAWCVANSSPTSRWSLRFEDFLMLANFVDHFERFGCYSLKCKHGTIVGLNVESSKYRALSKYTTICSSLSSLFPCLKFLYFDAIPVC